ncbi:hypothetical protein GE061_003602 [Apolygus lucorum]|uniref:Regulatory protein zeste n=1 Tax=Apolygus lucorum TaxID=248454 RepID=A0A8S9X6K9_APOLU|nr:hypothetical protein GE061_003602 [Apolygus lucorum]
MSETDVVCVQKKRGANFSPEERRQLIKLANEFSDIIENKKTDGVSIREKNRAWALIEEKYNATEKGPYRDAKALKMKYEGVKKELRKKENEWRVTGDGSSTSYEAAMPDEEIILRDKIALSVRGLQHEEGDDEVDDDRGINPSFLEMEVVEDKSGEIKVDWSSLQHRKFQTQKAPALRANSTFCTSSPTPIAIEPRATTSHRPEEPGNSGRRPVFRKKRIVRSSAGKLEELVTRKLAIAGIKREIALKKSRLLDIKIREAEARASEADLRLILAEKKLAAHQVRETEN